MRAQARSRHEATARLRIAQHLGAPPLVPIANGAVMPSVPPLRAPRCALRTTAQPSQHHRFPRTWLCTLVSGQGGVPPWPGPTMLSRSVGLQRGHAVAPPITRARCALCGAPASPLSPVWCSVLWSVAKAGYGPGQVLAVLHCAGKRAAATRSRLACASPRGPSPSARLEVRVVRCTWARARCGHSLRALRVT